MKMHKKTWQEFKASGLLWWINRTLPLFGYVIVLETDTGNAYPARVDARGFDEKTEEAGFKDLSAYLSHNAGLLAAEAGADDPHPKYGVVRHAPAHQWPELETARAIPAGSYPPGSVELPCDQSRVEFHDFDGRIDPCGPGLHGAACRRAIKTAFPLTKFFDRNGGELKVAPDEEWTTK